MSTLRTVVYSVVGTCLALGLLTWYSRAYYPIPVCEVVRPILPDPSKVYIKPGQYGQRGGGA